MSKYGSFLEFWLPCMNAPPPPWMISNILFESQILCFCFFVHICAFLFTQVYSPGSYFGLEHVLRLLCFPECAVHLETIITSFPFHQAWNHTNQQLSPLRTLFNATNRKKHSVSILSLFDCQNVCTDVFPQEALSTHLISTYTYTYILKNATIQPSRHRHIVSCAPRQRGSLIPPRTGAADEPREEDGGGASCRPPG